MSDEENNNPTPEEFRPEEVESLEIEDVAFVVSEYNTMSVEGVDFYERYGSENARSEPGTHLPYDSIFDPSSETPLDRGDKVLSVDADSIRFRSSTMNENPQKQRQRGSSSERLLAQAIRGEYLYSMLGLILGLAAIVGGIILGLNGVAGSTSWTAKVLGLESTVNDAAPGVVLFIVGIFLVFFTRPKVSMKDLKG